MKNFRFEKIMRLKTRNLSNITRYSGTKFIVPESVSDHCTDMVALGIYLGNIINDHYPNTVDIHKLVYKISIHDYDECLACDLPRSLKHYNKDINSAIELVINDMMKNNFDDELIHDIKSSKDPSPEGILVKVLDITQASLVIYREFILLGNHTIKDLFLDNRRYLSEFIDDKFGYPLRAEYSDSYMKIIYEYLITILSKLNSYEIN